MKPILLKHLAQLYTGFTIRESIEYLGYGEVKAVQIKDLPKNHHLIDTQSLTGIEWKYDSKPQFLPHNTILLVARGEPSAYLFTGSVEDKVVASNPFIVIKLLEDNVLPEYLVWYLNHANMAKNYFALTFRGSTLPLITLSSVKELPVQTPSLHKQQQIIDQHKQAQHEKTLLEQLITLRQEYNTVFAEHILNQAQ